jgi:hypothetical protein
MAEFETSWKQHSILELQKVPEHQKVHFGYPKMHLVIHISESIRRMGSGDNFTTDIPELLYISNVKDGYRSSKKVNYTQQILKFNYRCSGLDYMEKILHYLALQGRYDIDSAKVRNYLRVAFVLIYLLASPAYLKLGFQSLISSRQTTIYKASPLTTSRKRTA